MKNKDQYKRLILLLASGILLTMQTGIFVWTWYNSYAEVGSNYFVRGNYIVIALYALMTFFFYHLFGGFRIGQMRVFEMLYTQVLSVLSTNAVTYLQLCLIGRWQFLTNFRPMIHMTMVDLIVVLTWSLFVKWGHMMLFPPRKMLLVYGAYSPDNLIRKVESRKDRYAIEETICIDRDLELIKERILHYGVVVLTDIPAEIRNQLLKFCFEHNVRCYCVPKISDIMIRSADSIHLFDTTLLVFRNLGLTVEQRFAKRLFDILLGLVVCVVTAPLMAVIALAIKICDGGPVFFAQERLTKDGKVFLLYKFRSMRTSSQEQYCLTRKQDDRVTTVGRFLRASHLDELPQIYNILKGDMSFVGPRPECPELAEEYTKIVPEFAYRLKAKAGLTGYAQVYGQYNTTPYDKLKLDLCYITGYSFLLDLRLIVLTLKILLQKEKTEGIESWQTSAARDEAAEKLGSK